MRRRLAVTAVALVALTLPAPAGADVLDAYQRLAARGVSPAPLVPTTVPPVLRPLDRTISNGTTRGARGYSLRLVHYSPNGPDAIIVVTGGEFGTMRAFLRAQRQLGFRPPRKTRVRGHRGYLLTRRLGPTVRTLAWVERGVVYEISSGTPRKITLAHLRSTARGLDRLGRDWIGASSDPNSFSEGFAVTTRRTISVRVSFEAKCGSTIRVGQAKVTLLPHHGNAFAFDIADHRDGSEPWNGTVTGTISPAAVTLQVQANGTIDGQVCDSGPTALTLDRRVAGGSTLDL